MKYLLITFVFVFCIASDAIAGRVISGYVRNVYDGDTVVLATRKNLKLKVRLYGIDAPETFKSGKAGQPFGDIAKKTLTYKIMGKMVSAEIIEIDQYKRSVAILRYQGRDINREMVAEGLAWAYRQYLDGAYISQYIGAEEMARKGRKGLWRTRNPQPPWEFRHTLSDKKKRRR